MQRQKTVLIASSSLDEAVWKPVADILQQRGLKVIAYRSDKVSLGADELLYKIDSDGSIYLEYLGKAINPKHIDAAWYRRPIHFEPLIEDKGLQVDLNKNRRAVQNAIWRLIPEDKWLNSPQRIQEADFKPIQLMVAAQLGFTITETVISNRWQHIVDGLPEDKVFKPVTPNLYMHNKEYITYATRLRKNADLPLHGLPFPGYWQPYIAKKHEWRITVVGNSVFDTCILTKRQAKDDWRKHQDGSDKVTFIKADFPDEAKKKCLRYLKKFNLRYGAFDFIETPSGELVFLECNPNGQYTWLENELGHPIAKSIADELEAIANHQSR